ncbi:uncharacterized protein K441DRAFT_696424 [Cenococcum geophilum 1.58]|uniref:uncharacterized protein n=1 Tax=Cenococcum geophilum 1.58 TaxID=794803 RepID=UPI00358F1F38|nr:hypothetical protein K441DRAFT_696424 [Cenococcum geophilum 1.58]
MMSGDTGRNTRRGIDFSLNKWTCDLPRTGDEVTPAESAPKPSLERRVNSEPKVAPEAAVCFSSPPVNERSINLPRFPELAAELELCVLAMAVVSHKPIVDFKPARNGIGLSIPRVNKFMYENERLPLH